MTDLFPRHPAPVGRLGEQSEQAASSSEGCSLVAGRLEDGARRATVQVSDVLEAPARQSTVPVARTTRELSQASLLASGVLHEWMTAVEDYNASLVPLNTAWEEVVRRGQDREIEAARERLVRREAVFASVLDATGDRCAGRLAEGPTATQLRLLQAEGHVDATTFAEAVGPDSVDGILATLVARGVLPREVAAMGPDELQRYLVDHPEVARGLTTGAPGAGDGLEGRLAELSAPIEATDADAAARRREQVRELFESLAPDERTTLSLLFPSTVGNLSGAPFENRADANRVAVAVALDDERGTLSDLERRHEENQHDWDLFGRNNDDLEEPIDDSRSRIELYESILRDDRTILLFDPSDDGSIAELTGDIGPGTRNVGVHVPGTTTDMSSFQGVADTDRGFVANDPDDSLAMIGWMGGDLPDEVFPNAVSNGYSKDLAPLLAEFSHDVRQEIEHSAAAGQDVQTTYLGHSYGGAVVGLSETHGLDADRVLHVASAGMGVGVDGPDDLSPTQPDVHRYSMTAPGDAIGLSQGKSFWGLGHGADPDEVVTRLDTGNLVDGTVNEGTDAHSNVFQQHSDAWNNMYEVLTGGRATLYRELEDGQWQGDEQYVDVP